MIRKDDHTVRDYNTAFIKPLSQKNKAKEEKNQEYKEMNVANLKQKLNEFSYVPNPKDKFQIFMDQNDIKFINELSAQAQERIKVSLERKDLGEVNQ